MTHIINKKKKTKRQHYVSCGYQKGWTSEKWTVPGQHGQLWVYDLSKHSFYPSSPKNTLLKRFFYEDDRSMPTNEVEDWFQDFEGRYSDAMRYLHKVIHFLDDRRKNEVELEDSAKRGKCIEMIYSELKETKEEFANSLNALKEFAAISYARTPEIMRIKQGELQDFSDIRNLITTPYNFIKMFKQSSLIDRFKRSNVQIWIIPDGGIVSSDRPCFDFKTEPDEYSTLSCYDFMNRKNVAALMPLSTHLVAVFHPADAVAVGQHISQKDFSTKVITNPEHVKYINTAVVNFAGKQIISAVKDATIFDMRTVPLSG